MFDKIESIILQFTICLSIFSLNSCLNITEMSVPSVVWAPNKAVLTCVSQENNVNDSLKYILWYKLVDTQWKLIKVHPASPSEPMRAGTNSEMKAEEGETGETPKEEASEETSKGEATEEPPKEEKPNEPEKEVSEATPKAITEAITEAVTQPAVEAVTQPAVEAVTQQVTEVVTEAVTEAKPEDIPETKPEEIPKKKEEIYSLIGMVETEDPNIEFSQTSLSSAGFYKCVLNSTKEMKEQIREMRIFYKPEEGSKPELILTKIQDNHISVKCRAPASYPMMVLNFFLNYESAPHEEVHRLPAIRTKNTTYGTTDELLMNVEELRFRATKQSVLNSKILIACSATLPDDYQSWTKLDIDFEGHLYDSKCLNAPFIILIVVAVIIVITVILVIVWLYLRKKKLNSLNKVAELFNKQKTITVLIDNNTNDLKVE